MVASVLDNLGFFFESVPGHIQPGISVAYQFVLQLLVIHGLLDGKLCSGNLVLYTFLFTCVAG
jgi:hypothetical protein